MSTRNKHSNVLAQFFHSKLFLWIMFGIIVLVLLSYVRSYRQNYLIQKEIQGLQDEIASLEKKQLKSMEILEYVSSPAFVEEKARTELNLQKPGEKVIILEPSSTDTVAEIEEYGTIDRQTISNPKKWWYYFSKQPLSS